MAQTWLVTERRLRLLAVADRLLALVLPLLRALFPPRAAKPGQPERVLVTELWHIGDVVVMLPFLAALRERFPESRITLLAKAHAREVLTGSELVDEVIAHDFPWSYEDIEGRPKTAGVGETLAVVRRLRRERFDLAFDCSRDGRNHLVMFLTGAGRRVGFNFGGGARLLTDAVPVGELDRHRTEDWLRLLEPIGPATPRREPGLVVSSGEREWAADFLRSNGVRPGEFVVAVHPGGSSHLKRWSVESFQALLVMAAREFDARILWIVDPAGTGADAQLPAGSIKARPTLRQLMALLAQSRILVCNDGGAMHLAAAVGTSTFAVYSWGQPEWFRPVGPARHTFVRRTDITCRPCSGHCIYAEPICLTGLELGVAEDALRTELAELSGQRAAADLHQTVAGQQSSR